MYTVIHRLYKFSLLPLKRVFIILIVSIQYLLNDAILKIISDKPPLRVGIIAVLRDDRSESMAGIYMCII